MTKKILWIATLVVVAMLLSACAATRPDDYGGVTAPLRAGWPNVPCPPDDPSITARGRLNRIILWAGNAGQYEIVWLAVSCRDFHREGPNHVLPAQGMSEKVFEAWQHALAAKEAPDPGIAQTEWDACKGELEHDP